MSPRFRRYRFTKPMRDIPEAVCPTCGQREPNRLVGRMSHGRPVVHPAAQYPSGRRRFYARFEPPATKPVRLRKRHVVAGFRNAVLCADTFHGPWYGIPMPEKLPSPPRGRLGHNPDLRQAKADLSRALQGKARR